MSRLAPRSNIRRVATRPDEESCGSSSQLAPFDVRDRRSFALRLEYGAVPTFWIGDSTSGCVPVAPPSAVEVMRAYCTPLAGVVFATCGSGEPPWPSQPCWPLRLPTVNGDSKPVL